MILNLEQNVSLQAFNSFGVEVNAKWFCRLECREQLSALDNLPLPRLILGGGSNVLFTKDYLGTVVLNRLQGIALIDEDDQYYYVRAHAGENWHQFVLHAIENKWFGLEPLSLIPGTVGASPIQNIGAYGVEVEQLIDSVEVYDLQTKKICHLSHEKCQFSYRHSFFKDERGRYIVVSVLFRLYKKPQLELRYSILKEWFKKHDELLNPDNISKAVIEIRQSKLPDPSVMGNAGSFFHNPVLGKTAFEELQLKEPDLVHFPHDKNRVKLAAGQLIELCGFKGLYNDDGVGMYAKQALILVNLGEASGASLLAYAEQVKRAVKERFGIDLVPEPIIL